MKRYKGISVGDYVKVINSDRCYDTYEEMAKDMELENWEYGSNKLKDGRVIVIKNHKWNEDVLFAIEKENIQEIYGIDGIEKIENPEGTFNWAVEQMENGKRVIRKSIRDSCLILTYLYWEPSIGEFMKGYNESKKEHEIYRLCFADIRATDWEIYEENVFGDYEVKEDGRGVSIYTTDGEFVTSLDYLDDLEKAIKKARELKNV